MRILSLVLLFTSVLAYSQTDSTDVVFEEVSEDDHLIDDVEVPEEAQEVFEVFSVEKMAVFATGQDSLLRFIQNHLKYPVFALESDVQGLVMVRFVIDKNGKVDNLQVVSPEIGYGLEQEAMRVIKLTSGQWTPATHRDKPVRVRFQIPINYQLF